MTQQRKNFLFSPTHLALPTPGDQDQDDPLVLDDAAADAQYHRLVLRDLTDVGVTVAKAIGAEASARYAAIVTGDAERDSPLPGLATAYERTARAVRRTIALARRLAAPPRQRRATSRRQIIRAVEDAIGQAHPANDSLPEPGIADDLHAELAERLDDPALDDDIATRPIADIIADICRDLGLRLPGTDPASRTNATAQDAPGAKRRITPDLPPLSIRAAHPSASTGHFAAMTIPAGWLPQPPPRPPPNP